MACFKTVSSGNGSDWAATDYAHLLELDRAGWAWEWLRRNPDFVSFQLANEAHAPPGPAVVIQPGLAPERSLLRWGLLYG